MSTAFANIMLYGYLHMQMCSVMASTAHSFRRPAAPSPRVHPCAKCLLRIWVGGPSSAQIASCLCTHLLFKCAPATPASSQFCWEKSHAYTPCATADRRRYTSSSHYKVHGLVKKPFKSPPLPAHACCARGVGHVTYVCIRETLLGICVPRAPPRCDDIVDEIDARALSLHAYL